MSDKRRGEQPQRDAAVAEAGRRDGWRCAAEGKVPGIPCGGGLDGDEWDLRSADPGGHLDPGNIQLLCRVHHDWKHYWPVEAAHIDLRPYPVGYDGPRFGSERRPDGAVRRFPGSGHR